MTLLNLETIEKSPYITIDGEEIVDITSQIINDGYKMVFSEDDKRYKVGTDMTAKPSVMSQYIFGDSSKLDYLAYYNGFSNPFAIPAGYILRIPVIAKMDSIVGSNGDGSTENISRKLLNSKKSVVDEKRSRMIKSDVERTNMSETLSQNVVLSDRIILGNNSSYEVTAKKSIPFIENGIDELSGLIDYYDEFLGN